ncbi:MAG TPA: tetratricopeptide repeat protein [Acidimicrobiales bacterium]|jgi:putative thioredoxin|nr:tetratricopeptide repeat protein [Acidimicrobiales bacterium]
MSAVDVTDATFETAVLHRSAQATVVVDLWAPWCGPCLTLGPILEKVVEEAENVELVKIDIDQNPQAKAAFQVQSIPAVFAVRDAQVVDGFVGALPEPAVRQWVESLQPAPTEVDLLVQAGDETSLRQAIELEPANEKALLALAGVLATEGASDERRQEALALLAKVPESAESRHIAAQARLGPDAKEAGAGDDVEAKLQSLLERVRGDDDARQEFIDLLELLGPDDPRTAAYRKQLTARLF